MDYLAQLKQDFLDRKIGINALHYHRGVYYGYKKCCISNYMNLEELGFSQGLFMSVVLGHSDDSGHVLCPMCYEEYRKKHPENPDYEINFDECKPSVQQKAALYELLRDNLNK